MSSLGKKDVLICAYQLVGHSIKQALFGQYNNWKTPSWTCIKLGSKEDKLYDFEIKDRQCTGFFHPNSSFLRLLYSFLVFNLLHVCRTFGILLWNEDDSMITKSRVEKIDIGKYCLLISFARTFCLTCQTSRSGNPQGIKDPFDSEVNTLSI